MNIVGISGLATVWAEVLGVTRFGIHDNYFELGGNSMAAVRIMSKLEAASGESLLLRDFFEHPMVAGLAEVIDGLSRLAKSKASTHGAHDREEIAV